MSKNTHESIKISPRAIDESSRSVCKVPGEFMRNIFKRRQPEPLISVGLDLTQPISEVFERTDVVSSTFSRSSGSAALQFFLPGIKAWGADACVYLILSNDVWTDGLAVSWEFYVLYPTLRAEGVWTLMPNEDSTATLASYRISPTPEPGSPEHLLRLVSPQVAHYQDEAWKDRVALLKPLPEVRYDTPEAVRFLHQQDQSLFVGGPIRLKARRTPEGEAVWETNGFNTLRTPI
jgi:hypothetical protein